MTACSQQVEREQQQKSSERRAPMHRSFHNPRGRNGQLHLLIHDGHDTARCTAELPDMPDAASNRH